MTTPQVDTGHAVDRGALGRWAAGLMMALAVTIAFLTPVLWALSTSFKTNADLYAYPPRFLPGEVTLEHYARMWEVLDFPRLLANTVVFAGGVTVLAVICDTLAAYAFARLEFRGKNVIFALVMVTLMIPPQITLVPLFNLVSDMNLINTYPGLILPRAADAFGIFYLRQFFLSLPKDLENSARIDGAGELRILLRIALPLARPAVATLALFILMANWNELLWPLVMSTDGSLATLPSGLASFKGQHVAEYGPLMAGAVMAMLPMLVAFVAVQRTFVRSIASTGLK